MPNGINIECGGLISDENLNIKLDSLSYFVMCSTWMVEVQALFHGVILAEHFTSSFVTIEDDLFYVLKWVMKIRLTFGYANI